MEVTKVSSLNIFEDAGPMETSGLEVEYGFILQIISDSESDPSESSCHSQHEQELHA